MSRGPSQSHFAEKKPRCESQSTDLRKQPCPRNWARIQDRQIQQGPPAGKAGGLGLELLFMAQKSLASRIFCLCCRDCKEPQDMDDSNTSSQTQEHQTLTGLQLQKNELGRQNSKHASPGKPLIRHAEEDSFSSSYEFEALKTHNSERRFYKRNLNRYSQEHWPYRRCLIGRP